MAYLILGYTSFLLLTPVNTPSQEKLGLSCLFRLIFLRFLGWEAGGMGSLERALKLPAGGVSQRLAALEAERPSGANEEG